jgi:hypothetical protein
VYKPYPIVPVVRVYYRDCAFDPWRVYSSYSTEWQAYSAAKHLKYRGFEVSVRAW